MIHLIGNSLALLYLANRLRETGFEVKVSTLSQTKEFRPVPLSRLAAANVRKLFVRHQSPFAGFDLGTDQEYFYLSAHELRAHLSALAKRQGVVITVESQLPIPQPFEQRVYVIDVEHSETAHWPVALRPRLQAKTKYHTIQMLFDRESRFKNHIWNWNEVSIVVERHPYGATALSLWSHDPARLEVNYQRLRRLKQIDAPLEIKSLFVAHLEHPMLKRSFEIGKNLNEFSALFELGASIGKLTPVQNLDLSFGLEEAERLYPKILRAKTLDLKGRMKICADWRAQSTRIFEKKLVNSWLNERLHFASFWQKSLLGLKTQLPAPLREWMGLPV